uniref:ADP-ribosyl cyclase/cyclic ADP-ribose hydrolase n=1 Tax=Fagus sylvatica TaxID=28930 RepID=A0A2N9G555_FAGSY
MASLSTQNTSSSSSFSSFTPPWKYDVFLSFRGEDTRNNFTDHLYATLKQKVILIFRDEEKLERGKSISLELFKAIEESRFAIVILSRNYASSTWCLDELVKIIGCMKEMKLTVLPIFYDVDPSNVRKQTGIFAQAFAKHEEHFKDNIEKVQIWRTALREVANLKGWHVKDRPESEIIQDIVKGILHKSRHTFLVDKKGLVGINSRVEKLKSHLAIGLNDVRMVGIIGMGGIGKTTLAKVVYNMVSFQFEACSFISNVRQVSEKCGLPQLQQTLLNDLLMERDTDIHDVDNGALMIKNMLHRKRILLVLDDVDELDQLKSLAGRHDWFGPGSRIIITTRNKHLLKTHQVDDIYEAKGLNNDEALDLFNSKAFGTDHPAEYYLELSKEFVLYASGLPLAIEVMGSFLLGKSINEWKNALGRLKEFPERKVHSVLQTSFDGLEETEKNIFLDISCFFNHKDKDRVIEILDGLGLYAEIGLRVLIDKSLIKLYGNQLWMHDLLQEMGREIVRQKCPKDPGKRSRLWSYKDIDNVLTKNTGTEAVEGLVLTLPEPKEVHWNPNAFSKMKSLKLLVLHNVHLPRGLKALPDGLRILDWKDFPSKSLPLSSQPHDLVELRMCSSKIKRLWQGIKSLNNLKFIELKNSQQLIETPDFTQIPSIEKLVLEGCINLHTVHPSIGVLKKLTLLNLKGCKNLINLPSKFEMESLETLILTGCSKIKQIPEFGGNMERVSKLYVGDTSISHLPSSIGNLTSLASLDLRDCKNLVSLPSTTFDLKLLKDVDISGCSKLERLPENLGNAESIKVLDLSGTSLRQVPSSICLLKNLERLYFRGCKGLSSTESKSWYDVPSYSWPRSEPVESLFSLVWSCSLTKLDLSNCNLLAVPDTIGCVLSLEELNLSGNNFVSLPDSIIRLHNLEVIYLDNCTSLLTLPVFPLNMNYISASNCTSLDSLPYKLKPNDSFEPSLHLLNCLNLADNPGLIDILLARLKALLQGLPRQYPMGRYNLVIPGSEIPKWFSHQNMGDEVNINEPSHLCNEWMGIAVCALFFSNKHHPCDQINNHHELACHLIANGNHIYPLAGISSIAKVLSDHIWLLYLFPQNYDKHSINLLWEYNLNGFNQIGIRIETKGSGLTVKKCGFRLVYMKEIEDLKRTMGQSSNNLEDNKIKRSHDDYDGAGPSGEGSFNDVPHPKRIQRPMEFMADGKSDCEESSSSEYEECYEEFSDSD